MLKLKAHIFIGMLAFCLAGCSSGIGPVERLNWYVPFVPGNLIIEKFYETPSPSMDHEYMWKIKVADNDAYRHFESQFTKSPPNADGINDFNSVAVYDNHPNWWKSISLTNGTLYKHRVAVISGHGQRAYLFALIDKDTEASFWLSAYRTTGGDGCRSEKIRVMRSPNQTVEATAPRAFRCVRHSSYNIVVPGGAALTGAVPLLIRYLRLA